MSALSKLQALRRMTVANGCTPHEAQTAAQIATAMLTKGVTEEPIDDKPQTDTRYSRAAAQEELQREVEYRMGWS